MCLNPTGEGQMRSLACARFLEIKMQVSSASNPCLAPLRTRRMPLPT